MASKYIFYRRKQKLRHGNIVLRLAYTVVRVRASVLLYCGRRTREVRRERQRGSESDNTCVLSVAQRTVAGLCAGLPRLQPTNQARNVADSLGMEPCYHGPNSTTRRAASCECMLCAGPQRPAHQVARPSLCTRPSGPFTRISASGHERRVRTAQADINVV